MEWNKLSPERFTVLEVDVDIPIRQFVCRNGLDFKTGKRFYELTKREKIQDYKEILLMDKSTRDVFEVDRVRKILGIPQKTCTRKMSLFLMRGVSLVVKLLVKRRKVIGKTPLIKNRIIVTLKPDDLNNKMLSKYIVFIQSTSVNRKLIEGTKFLYKDGCIQLSLFPNGQVNS